MVIRESKIVPYRWEVARAGMLESIMILIRGLVSSSSGGGLGGVAGRN